MQAKTLSVKTATVLAMAMALGPFALDTYLPAFPVIAQSLDVSVHQVSLSISLYIFVLALGQLFGGPLSDRFGRSKVMLSGIALFAIASIFLSFANSLSEFLLLRVLQALGGGAATVTVPALVRDRLSGTEAAKFFGLIGLFMALAPAVAPNIGSLILVMAEWHYIFVFLGAYALVAMLLLSQTVFKQKAPTVVKEKIDIIKRYKQVIANRPALRFIVIGSLTSSILMLFIAHASYIYQGHFEVTPGTFSLLFSANVVLMLVANLSNRFLLNHYSAFQILRGSLTLQAGAILLLITISLFQPVLILFVLAMVFTIGALGATSPNIQACYMDYFEKNGGTAAALMGATQFSVAGIVSAASTLLPEGILSIVLAQGACSLICVLLIWRMQTDSVQTQTSDITPHY